MTRWQKPPQRGGREGGARWGGARAIWRVRFSELELPPSSLLVQEFGSSSSFLEPEPLVSSLFGGVWIFPFFFGFLRELLILVLPFASKFPPLSLNRKKRLLCVCVCVRGSERERETPTSSFEPFVIHSQVGLVLHQNPPFSLLYSHLHSFLYPFLTFFFVLAW